MADTTSDAAAHAPPRKTYRGNCHCGAFVFEAQTPEIAEVGYCNCSICVKKAYLHYFLGAQDTFTVVKGADALRDYTFGEGKLVHKFCPECGTAVYATMPGGPPGSQLALNVHAIQGLNTWDLARKGYDGLKLGKPYDPPAHKGELPTGTVENGKTYTGSCHCGDVTVAVVCAPLDESFPGRMIECNCSICERNGYIWIYPETDRVVLSGDDEHIGRYQFNARILSKTFCKRCGVNLTNEYNPLSDEELAALPEAGRAWANNAKLRHPVNVRVLHGVDVAVLKPERLDGASNITPPYKNP